MTALLDVTLATITGIIVILTILFSILNVQQMSYNLQVMLGVYEHVAVITDISYGLPAYLERAGRHLADLNIPPTPPSTVSPGLEPMFTMATNDRMTFRYKDNFYDDNINIRVVDIQYLTNAPGGRIEVSINGALQLSTLPYLLEEPRYTYYDRNNAVIANPGTNQTLLNNIRSCRVDLIFRAPGWGRDDVLQIRYPITAWTYFKNTYLRP